jgi:hypothetical protein
VSRLIAAVLALAIGLGGIWAIDPGGLTALVVRARALVAPLAPEPTAAPSPVSTAAPPPTAAPQPTSVPTPTP